jgi:flavin-dependent dehydrogenase
VVFHGDSVPLNKPYTGGGLHYIFKLSPVLAELIEENRLREYSAYYTRIFYSKCLLERVVVNYLRKLKTYFLPTRVVKQLNSLSLLQELDFDKHYRLILKSISVAPVLAMLGFSGVIKALYNALN